MPKTFIKKSGGWTEIRSIFVKKTTGWAEVKNVFLKKATGWVKVFTKASLPDTTTAPSLRTTNYSGSGTIYDGPIAISPIFLNEDLFGKDGAYTNYTSIFGRKLTSASTANAVTRSLVVTGDLFTSGGGVTTTIRSGLDEQYLFYELTVQNGSSANEIYPISTPMKMIKSEPVGSSTITTSDITTGSVVTFNYTIENYYYNRLEGATSVVKWWRSSTGNAGGTLLKTETVSATTTSSSSSSLSGSSSYTVTSADNNFYIVAEIIPENSWIRHYGYSGSYSFVPKSTAMVGSVFQITNHSMSDEFDNDGLDNRFDLPVEQYTKVKATIVGVDTTTTFRTRYRVFNWQSGTYYNVETGAISTESGSWVTYTSDYYNVGGISDITISGSTAYLTDYLQVPSAFFDGGTYGGGSYKWQIEIEISAIKNGKSRIYYSAPYIPYYLTRASNSTLNVSSASAGINSNITISGGFTGFPAGTAYPKAYKVDYGDGTNSGWNYFSYGTGNPTYSLTKSYSSAGTYYPTVTTIPYYTSTQKEVVVAAVKTAPTITSVSATKEGAPVSVSFTGGSGPAYQMYWTSGVAPTFSVTPDASGTSSPLTDSTGPTPYTTQWYMYVRSVSTTTENSVGPSPVASAWSTGYPFTVTSSILTAPTINNVSVSNTGGPVSVSFTGGSGPAYQAFWWSSATPPTGITTPDASGTSSPLTDSTGPSTTGTNYMYVRSVATVGETSAGPSTVASSWSSGVQFNMTQPPIIPTITMAANTGVTSSAGTINWTSTNQASYSVNGTFSASGNPDTTTRSVSKTGLAASTTYTGTVTVTSSTGNTASASYSLTTSSAAVYTITYNGNGNTGGSTTATTGSGTVTLRANGFTRTNCSFQGWATSAGGAVSYPAGFSYNLTADVTLYAVWAADPNSATAPPGFKFDGNNLPTSGRKRWSWTGTGTVTGGVRTGFRVQISSTSATSGFSIATGSPLPTTARSYDIAVSPVTSARWLRIASEYTDGLGVARVGTFTAAL
jgi:hypothetical protein